MNRKSKKYSKKKPIEILLESLRVIVSVLACVRVCYTCVLLCLFVDGI